MQEYGGNHSKVGHHIIYTDTIGNKHSALITAVWGPDLGTNAINLVYVIDDGDRNDPYGRQIERVTSVSPKGANTAHGRFYEVV